MFQHCFEPVNFSSQAFGGVSSLSQVAIVELTLSEPAHALDLKDWCARLSSLYQIDLEAVVLQ